MAYSVVTASDEQMENLLRKHLSLIGKKLSIISRSYRYDSEDDIGFVTLKTITGKTVSYQLRKDKAMFVEFTGFGSVRYDVHYPTGEMETILTENGIKAKNAFWAGAEI